MKRFLVASLFCASTIVNAQSNTQFVTVNKPVICGPVEIILKGLADKDINEKPVWTGRRDDQKTEFFVFLNFETSAFTIIETGREIACILGLGAQSNFFPSPTESNTRKKISYDSTIQSN